MKKTVIIEVFEFDTATNLGGDNLYEKITLHPDDNIVLSFTDVSFVTTSFLNSSIGQIANEMGFYHYKQRFKLKNMSISVYQIIKRYYDSFEMLSSNV